MCKFLFWIITSLFIWYISNHHVKYLDKPIKCLEMRAKIKSGRTINEIFLCICTYIWKSDIFSTFLNFDKKYFFDYFKSQISKCIIYKKLFPHVIRHMHPSGRNDKLTLPFFHYQNPVSISAEKNLFSLVRFKSLSVVLSGASSLFFPD